MAQSAAKANPQFRIELTSLDQKTMIHGNETPASHVTRLLEILSATMEVSTMWPLLGKFFCTPMLRSGRKPCC